MFSSTCLTWPRFTRWTEARWRGRFFWNSIPTTGFAIAWCFHSCFRSWLPCSFSNTTGLSPCFLDSWPGPITGHCSKWVAVWAAVGAGKRVWKRRNELVFHFKSLFQKPDNTFQAKKNKKNVFFLVHIATKKKRPWIAEFKLFSGTITEPKHVCRYFQRYLFCFDCLLWIHNGLIKGNNRSKLDFNSAVCAKALVTNQAKNHFGRKLR